MAKTTKKAMKITDLTVDFGTNVREVDNYDLVTMEEQIREAGRILQAIHVRGEDNVVLAGNRRTLAGQKLYNDPSCPSDLKEALNKVDCIVHTGLTKADEIRIILDHGGAKPISRTEIVKSVWRMDKEFFSEKDIILQTYYSLAKYSGNEKKLATVPTDAKAREAFLKKWFHGTVGNFILSAARMGDFVREQFILTHRAEDGLLTEDEKKKLVMKTSRDRISQLSAAKTKDKDAKGWEPLSIDTDGKMVGGGESFNKLVEIFKEEDTNGKPRTTKDRPSAKELKDKADAFKSPLARKILLLAAGEADDVVKGIIEDDETAARDRKVMELFAANVAKFPPAVQEVLKLAVNPAEPVEKVLAELVKLS